MLHPDVQNLIQLALSEDLGTDLNQGDLTSLFFIPEHQTSHGVIIARQPGILAGMQPALEVFKSIDPQLELINPIQDGTPLQTGSSIVEIKGSTRSILTAERTALNFLQRLSGVATKTNQFVSLIQQSSAQILDTRKTTPGWRQLEKEAVRAGGGLNHRMGLFDRVMIKDNHLFGSPSLSVLQDSINHFKTLHPSIEIEIEADTLAQVSDFLMLEGVDHILLDNMSLAELKQAVALRAQSRSNPYLEASGGITLDSAADIALTGVDFLSIGALTHSAVSLDLALDFT